MPVEKQVGEEERNGTSCSPEGELRCARSFVLKLFSLSLTGGNLRGGLRGGLQLNIHQLSRFALLGSWSSLIGQCSWSWCCPPGFAAFLGLELKYN